jgi:DNA mismatch repair ATPase MutS
VPRLCAAGDGTPLSGENIGHPLLPDTQKIGNDFTFARLGDLAIITGSNMAGKSTFLRALGVNLALAYAGGPVDAAALTTAYFRLFTSIRVTDSVTDGISYFYAEVQRLTALLAAVQDDQPYPVFFLIDEIFRGTNNRERLIGSQAFVRALAGQNSVGAIATHDLELVRLADDRPEIHNYHFRDAIAEGRMVFDYTLRPGPCPTTNALHIMRAAGLPIGATE